MPCGISTLTRSVSRGRFDGVINIIISTRNIASDGFDDTSTAMASEDDEEPDLMLVSTYFPVIVAMLKASALVALSEVLSHVNVSLSVRAITYALFCYMDVNRVRAERFERACGFLLICAAAVMLRDMRIDRTCDGWSRSIELILDSAWAVASSTWGSLVCLGMLSLPVNVLVAGVSGMAAGHEVLTCSVMSIGELLSRVYCYMSMCAVMFFAKRQVRSLDRNSYMRSIPFVCSHVLVVGVYVAVPSLAVCMSLFVWSTYKTDAPRIDADLRTEFRVMATTERTGETRAGVERVGDRSGDRSGDRMPSEDARLLLQLRQAMSGV